ncbi:hypothetical protein [Streptomyces sp. NPDC058657]
MTWPAAIATVLGVVAALLLHASQHGPRSTPPEHDPPDGDPP